MQPTPHPAIASRRAAVVLAALALVATLLSAAPLPARAQAASASFDGDPSTTERIVAGDPATAALEVSRVRFSDAPGEPADPATDGRYALHAVLATDATFADSLAGAALTTDGPLLLTAPEALDAATAAELDRVLGDGGTVYILGGTEALSPQVEADITALGLSPVRLEGESRVETALAVAEEVRRLSPSDTVLLARADGPADNPTAAWADSVTGGSLAAAARVPIVVTPTSEVHPAVAAWLAEVDPSRTILLGGEAALSAAVEAAVPAPTRLAGPERTATAAAIAAWGEWPRSDGRRFLVLDGGRADGWAYGLSAAGLASDAGAPPLMVVGDVTPPTRREVSTCGAPEVDLVIVGDESVVPADVESRLATFDGQSCAPEFASLDTFADCTSTLEYFRSEALERVGPYGLDSFYYGAPEVLIGPMPEPAPAPGGEAAEGGSTTGGEAPTAAPQEDSADAAAGGGADADVSGTNVQEAGVDEPDRVKVTREAAFIANGSAVEVVALSPDGAPSHLTTIDVPGEAYGHELLLSDGVLLVLGRGDGYVHPAADAPQSTSFAPPYYFPDPTTTIARYDVTTPGAPVLLDSTSIDGEYRSARMVDGVVRLVTSSNPTGLHFVFPEDGSQEAADSALAHNRQVIEESTLQQWLPQVGEGDAATPLLDCADVHFPPSFSGVSTVLVSTIDVDSGVTPTSAAAVVAQGETIYASTQRLVVSSSQWGAWVDEQPPAEGVTTLVHAFDISDPATTSYVASGQVPGYALNSFAISERNGYYRIATTTEPPWNGDIAQGETDNGITILTEGGAELFEVGRVFGLGLGERIFAVRHLTGDLAAVITFRQTDPLYLVDLSNPAAPRVTGELKIPGVSRYLHPIGETHLLGVGQDGDDEGNLTGLQVSLFDITDRSAPTRVDSLEFGPGDSPVEYDHKAFLWWAPLGRALVPANLYGPNYESFDSTVQAIDVDAAGGQLTLAGAVRQPQTQDGHTPSVDRTFIAEGVLYTLSYEGVSAHDLATLADRGHASLPRQEGECCIVID